MGAFIETKRFLIQTMPVLELGPRRSDKDSPNFTVARPCVAYPLVADMGAGASAMPMETVKVPEDRVEEIAEQIPPEVIAITKKVVAAAA